MAFRRYIDLVVNGINLNEVEAMNAMNQVMDGVATPAQIAAFVTALRMKGETVDEITGFARVMRERAKKLNLRTTDLIDTCGTGGDGKQTFNISTAAAFVVAGCGLSVAKHGNRSVSSSCGSADVLEQLGVKVSLSTEQVQECIDSIGIGFLFAPDFHQSMKYAGGARKEIGIRTVFNILGPLTNPAGARSQILGVFDPALTEPLARVLQKLGTASAFVVHGSDGLDEVTHTGPTKITALTGEGVYTYYFSPEEVGLTPGKLADITGGGAAANAQIIRAVLSGERGPARDITLLNASLALVAGFKAATIQEALALAVTAIDSGAALGKLESLVVFSQRCVA